MKLHDVELEEDGSLALSSLKALYSNATGLFFSSESGRRRSVRVVDNKCFPPQGKWGERVYKVVVPETDVNEATLLLLRQIYASPQVYPILCLLLCQIYLQLEV